MSGLDLIFIFFSLTCLIQRKNLFDFNTNSHIRAMVFLPDYSECTMVVMKHDGQYGLSATGLVMTAVCQKYVILPVIGIRDSSTPWHVAAKVVQGLLYHTHR